MSSDKQKEITSLLHEAENLIRKAEDIADDNDLSFRFELEYGMGGCYDGEDSQWHPSSQSC